MKMVKPFMRIWNERTREEPKVSARKGAGGKGPVKTYDDGAVFESERSGVGDGGKG